MASIDPKRISLGIDVTKMADALAGMIAAARPAGSALDAMRRTVEKLAATVGRDAERERERLARAEISIAEYTSRLKALERDVFLPWSATRPEPLTLEEAHMALKRPLIVAPEPTRVRFTSEDGTEREIDVTSTTEAPRPPHPLAPRIDGPTRSLIQRIHNRFSDAIGRTRQIRMRARSAEVKYVDERMEHTAQLESALRESRRELAELKAILTGEPVGATFIPSVGSGTYGETLEKVTAAVDAALTMGGGTRGGMLTPAVMPGAPGSPAKLDSAAKLYTDYANATTLRDTIDALASRLDTIVRAMDSTGKKADLFSRDLANELYKRLTQSYHALTALVHYTAAGGMMTDNRDRRIGKLEKVVREQADVLKGYKATVEGMTALAKQIVSEHRYETCPTCEATGETHRPGCKLAFYATHGDALTTTRNL
jgi:hypothetical protein